MGQSLPFSSIDQYLQRLGGNAPGCIVDTQFLIAATEEHHPFYDDAKFLFEKLAEYGVSIFTTVTTRAEFIDVRRRMIITETLMDMLAPSSKWKISTDVRKLLRAQKTWIDAQASNDSLPILTDSRIKDCKEAFLPRTQSGKVGWIKLCEEYLAGRLLESWNILVANLGLNYLDMRSEGISRLIPQKVEWEKMYALSEATSLGSSDAMILNVLKCSTFPFVASADFDLAYAVLADPVDRTVLVPDNLHYKKIKGLRF
jgi:predicted nucleic acid-binding protein